MKTARLVNDEDGQAVLLPEEFRFSGSEVLIKREGSAVVLLPKSWDILLSSLNQFSKDFMKYREQPGHRDREDCGS